ncbi:Cupredoxin [Hyaloraphidium curvatum]|nr:Cupredoxin [Hyaloraphidium curvatum]
MRRTSSAAFFAIAALALGTLAGAANCPDIGNPPAGTRRFSLEAANFASPYQTLAYNGTAVGPLIRVALGDTVQVDVTNKDISGGTSTHWHGQELLNSSWADGVAGVNQYPIPVGSTFSYRFKAFPAGTHWYHSHTGGQYGDGLRGPLIVTDPNDPNAGLYDADLDEHVLMLADVFSTTVEAQLAKLEMQGMANMKPLCDPAFLDQDISDAPWLGAQVNGNGLIFGANATSGEPYVVKVQSGKRYRLRFIGGMSSWALQIAPRNHTFSIIALDGRPVEPVRASSILISSGERMDMVLEANQPVANYWIDLSTINGFNAPIVLHYEGAADPANDTSLAATLVKDLGCASGIGGRPGVVDPKNATFHAAAGTPKPPQKADKQFTVYLPDASATSPPAGFANASSNIYGINGVTPQNGSCPGGSKYCWALNWVVFKPASVPDIFYASSVPTDRTLNLEADLGDVVDVVFVNPSTMVHPMHIHGYAFSVLATGNGDILGPDGRLSPSVPLDLSAPASRDTVPVAQVVGSTPGYAVVRIKADNPGPWSFHCHIDLHAGSGMFMTLTVKPKGVADPWIVPKDQACGVPTATPTASRTGRRGGRDRAWVWGRPLRPC